MFKRGKIKFIQVGILCSCLFYFLCAFSVQASTDTVPRTEENLRVPSYVNVTDENRFNILDTPSVDAAEKIYDFADLYTDNEEKELYQSVTQYIEKYSLDLAIVTISENSKIQAKTYAEDFYDYNEFGMDSSHSGILFLVDMDTRKIYMLTTGSAISMYNNVRVDKILDKVFTYMSDKKYAEGSQQFVTIIGNYMEKGIPQKNENRYGITSSGEIVKSIPYVGIFIFAIIVTVVILAVLISRNRLVQKANSSRGYLKKDSTKIDKISDLFLGSHVTKVAISHNSGGGGSSTSSGSSGVSHGGGGRGF